MIDVVDGDVASDRGEDQQVPELRDLPLDSLDVVELMCATEDEFGVLLTSDTCLNARTVGDLAQTIARRRTRPKEVTR